MKLFTHNLLMCNKKGCTINNFPLKIKCNDSNIVKFEYDEELIKKTLKKLDLPALTQACKDVNFNYDHKQIGIHKFDFETLSNEDINSKDNLEYINHVIFEIRINDALLICNNCAREYKIWQGIANMVLHEEELEQ